MVEGSINYFKGSIGMPPDGRVQKQKLQVINKVTFRTSNKFPSIEQIRHKFHLNKIKTDLLGF